ncbi:MAG: hypothetical protein CVV03_11525 [Firmicutes bacterium HGW-Firmicutes-8]|nr:MAG: hypothetical protein CVV03_11525 [Firmicutes bacterium HGW-Firmicutes-8]
MKKSWRNDWYIVGSLAGLTASMLKTLVNLGFYKTGVSKLHYVDIAGGFILGKRGGVKPRKPIEQALGFVADALLGAAFGASLSYLISKTPKGYEITKGSLFGAALWTSTLSTGTLLQIDGLSNPDPKSMTTMLASSIVYGAGTGLMIKGLGKFDKAEQVQPMF